MAFGVHIPDATMNICHGEIDRKANRTTLHSSLADKRLLERERYLVFELYTSPSETLELIQLQLRAENIPIASRCFCSVLILFFW